MEDSYLTLEKPAEGVFRDRNSRFLAFGYPVDHVEQVQEIVTTLRKKYHDARHHCYAYRINPEKEAFRMNDDGEPSGTAGKPIYNQLVSHKLINVLIVVVRYFGGTLLGTGGLINAYRAASGEMLRNATIVTRYIEDLYSLKFPYEKMSGIMKLLKEEDLPVVKPVYGERCAMTLKIRRGAAQHFLEKLPAIGEITVELLVS